MAKNFFVLMRTLLLLDLCIHSDDGHAVLVIAYTFAAKNLVNSRIPVEHLGLRSELDYESMRRWTGRGAEKNESPPREVRQ